MKKIALCFTILLLFTTASRAQESDQSKIGLGFQISSSPLFLFSWQSADLNPYGRSWRIEPTIGFTYSDNEGTLTNTSASLTLGVGTYMRWRVRAPFDNLYFTMGPRVLVTGFRTTSQVQPSPDTLPRIDRSSQYLVTTLSFLAGPEYSIDQWGQHFTVAGFVSLGATITGRAKLSPGDYTTSTWSLGIATGTGIVLRYYFAIFSDNSPQGGPNL